MADPTRVLAALDRYDEATLRTMRVAMARAAQLLDTGPRGSLAEEVLRRFARVARGETPAVPRTTKTPLRVLDL